MSRFLSPSRKSVLLRAVAAGVVVALGSLATAIAEDEKRPPSAAGAYLVVAAALDQAGADAEAFREVAQRVAVFHKGELIEFDGRDFDGLAKRIKDHTPPVANVLIVVPPTVLDCNFQRHIFKFCNTIDEDLFADFAFGYLTAGDGAQLRRLWERIEKLHVGGLTGKTWIEASVAGGMTSTVYPEGGLSITRAAGFRGPQIYWAEKEADPNVLKFVDEVLPQLEQADVLVFCGNGDPQGIWLFSGNRNMDETKHWLYAAEKVGNDPQGEMPRITGERLAKLKLKSPIIWSGTCHSATPCNVYIEGDIVSTFGTVEKMVLHKLKPAESLCLALLDAGAAALLAPIGPNHGYSTINETQFGLTHGATLGETLLSTYNDVLLASDGRPGLAFYRPGVAHREAPGTIMWYGGSNRILIGDPALAPFQATPDPLERCAVTQKRADGFDVRIEWKEGFHPYTWDIYGRDHTRDGRVYARIALDDLGDSGQGSKFSATVAGQDAAGNVLPLGTPRVEFEDYHGRRYLHLQTNAPRESIDRKEVRVTFTVKRAE